MKTRAVKDRTARVRHAETAMLVARKVNAAMKVARADQRVARTVSMTIASRALSRLVVSTRQLVFHSPVKIPQAARRRVASVRIVNVRSVVRMKVVVRAQNARVPNVQTPRLVAHARSGKLVRAMNATTAHGQNVLSVRAMKDHAAMAAVPTGRTRITSQRPHLRRKADPIATAASRSPRTPVRQMLPLVSATGMVKSRLSS